MKKQSTEIFEIEIESVHPAAVAALQNIFEHLGNPSSELGDNLNQNDSGSKQNNTTIYMFTICKRKCLPKVAGLSTTGIFK